MDAFWEAGRASTQEALIDRRPWQKLSELQRRTPFNLFLLGKLKNLTSPRDECHYGCRIGCRRRSHEGQGRGQQGGR